MKHSFPALLSACSLIAICGLSQSASADISGFTLGTYTYNQADGGSPAVVGPNSIQVTTGGSQVRSIWFNTRQAINQFSATFTYRQAYTDSFAAANGFAFVLSNNPGGTSVLGNANDASGYSGITQSAAVTFHTTQGSTSLGFYRNGNVTSGDTNTGAVQFANRRDILVSIVYDGNLLSVSMADGAFTFGPQQYLVGSLSTSLGSSTAYVGFTASTSSGNPSNHFLSNFTYAVPSPATTSLLSIAGVTALRRRRKS